MPWFANPALKNIVKKSLPQSYINSLLLRAPKLLAALRYESQLSEEQVQVLYSLLEKDIAGEVIECGVYRGGTTALMALHLKARRRPKKIYALDSFAGFADEEIQHEVNRGFVRPAGQTAFTANSAEYVQRKMEKLNLDNLVEIVPGYFEETLDTIPGSFSLAFIDCDLEKSIEYCLAALWDRIVPGGSLVVDDYSNPGYPGARIACDQFLKDAVCTHSSVQHGLMVIEK